MLVRRAAWPTSPLGLKPGQFAIVDALVLGGAHPRPSCNSS